MALIDVSELLSDPDFLNYGLVCERNLLEIGVDGVARKTTKLIKFNAVVTPDTGEILDRTGEGERIKGRITIHTSFRLLDGAEGGTADIVRWDSKRFTVSNISNNMNWGRGFVSASCDVIPYTGV